MLKKRWIATVAALLIFAASRFAVVQLAMAAEGEVSLGSGVNYSSGTYGSNAGSSASTHILTIPFTARYEREAWTLRATLPYLRITGPGNVIPGFGPIGTVSAVGNSVGLPLLGGSSASQTSSKTVSGLGDATVAATYTFYAAEKTAGVGLTGRLKFATGDETQALGTGSTDKGLQLEGFRRFERNTLFGVVGYTFFGDSPIAEFHNVANFGLGASHRTDTDDVFGVTFDARQAGSPAPAALRELSGFWTHPLDRNWRVQLYALKGFATGSPDWGAGLNAAYAF
ncbi:MAG TPA: hypothetical protein VE085_08275 [Burkholderiales bacterium]|nr:hypothetical protein [Burkholderiales bacterium]